MGRSLFLQALWGFQVTHVRVSVSMGPFGIPRVCKGTMDWGNIGDHSGKCHMVVSLNYCSQNGGNLYRAPYYNGNPNIGPRIIGNLDQYPYGSFRKVRTGTARPLP